MAAALESEFGAPYVQEYRHWETGKPVIDVVAEAQRLVAVIGDAPCAIVAKSAGTLVAMSAAASGLGGLARCVFLGLPVGWAKERGIDVDMILSRFAKPATVFQNTGDPICNYGEVAEYLRGRAAEKIHLVPLRGDSHDYGAGETAEAVSKALTA